MGLDHFVYTLKEGDFHGGKVDRSGPKHQHGVTVPVPKLATTGDEIVDARLQLAHVEGFGQIIIGATLQSDQSSLIIGPGCQQNEGDMAGARVGLQAGTQGKAVHARHHHIGNDQIGKMASRRDKPVAIKASGERSTAGI